MTNISIGGCAKAQLVEYYTYAYSVGSVVYVLQKATKGALEKIVIKHVQINQNKNTFMRPIFLYIDTLNGIWLEPELCTQDEAVALVEKYYNDKIEKQQYAEVHCQGNG